MVIQYKKWLGVLLALTLQLVMSDAIAAGLSDEQIKQSRDITSQEQMRQQERENLLRQQQETQPDARKELESLKNPILLSDVIPEHESPCFTVNQIRLEGDSADKFQFALDEVLSRGRNQNRRANDNAILGSCLGVVGINAVMVRVQNLIIAKGYVTTRVLAAPQDLKSGLLKLTIIAGRISAIRFTPDSSRYTSVWNSFPINAGDILNLRDIEQALENLKRVPTADANIQILPAADSTKPGVSDLEVRYQQRFPLRVAISVDDSGYNTTGRYQGSTTVSGDNLFSLNDLLYLSYNHDLGGGDPGKRGTKGYTVHYSLPWDYWLLGITASENKYHQEVAGASQSYIYSGDSDNTEIKLSRLIYRNNINKTNLSLRGFLRNSRNYIDDTEIEVQRRRTAGWEFGFN